MSIDAKPGSMFHAAQNWLSPKAKRIIKECFNNQTELTRRLSTPKQGVRARDFEQTVSGGGHTLTQPLSPSESQAFSPKNRQEDGPAVCSLKENVAMKLW